MRKGDGEERFKSRQQPLFFDVSDLWIQSKHWSHHFPLYISQHNRASNSCKNSKKPAIWPFFTFPTWSYNVHMFPNLQSRRQHKLGLLGHSFDVSICNALSNSYSYTMLKEENWCSRVYGCVSNKDRYGAFKTPNVDCSGRQPKSRCPVMKSSFTLLHRQPHISASPGETSHFSTPAVRSWLQRVPGSALRFPCSGMFLI